MTVSYDIEVTGRLTDDCAVTVTVHVETIPTRGDHLAGAAESQALIHQVRQFVREQLPDSARHG